MGLGFVLLGSGIGLLLLRRWGWWLLLFYAVGSLPLLGAAVALTLSVVPICDLDAIRFGWRLWFMQDVAFLFTGKPFTRWSFWSVYSQPGARIGEEGLTVALTLVYPVLILEVLSIAWVCGALRGQTKSS
jgi:hypothetical protein